MFKPKCPHRWQITKKLLALSNVHVNDKLRHSHILSTLQNWHHTISWSCKINDSTMTKDLLLKCCINALFALYVRYNLYKTITFLYKLTFKFFNIQGRFQYTSINVTNCSLLTKIVFIKMFHYCSYLFS